MINPRAIAVQGIGYAPGAVATQGFLFVGVAVVLRPPGGGGGIGPYAMRRRARRGETFDQRSDIALAYQIEEEDEIVVALVMAAVPLIGS